MAPPRRTNAKGSVRGSVKAPAGAPGSVRIIAGAMRGRKVAVPDAPGLRPTPDRVRETLFNWIAPLVEGAQCLDLFAGSGALGFEAASRGAAGVVMVEREPRIAAHLAAEAQRLGAAGVRVERADALDFLAAGQGPFDLVFVDPPYRQGLVAPVLARLAGSGLLTPAARIYVEAEVEAGEPALPEGWAVVRRMRAGEVNALLLST